MLWCAVPCCGVPCRPYAALIPCPHAMHGGARLGSFPVDYNPSPTPGFISASPTACLALGYKRAGNLIMIRLDKSFATGAAGTVPNATPIHLSIRMSIHVSIRSTSSSMIIRDSAPGTCRASSTQHFGFQHFGFQHFGFGRSLNFGLNGDGEGGFTRSRADLEPI